MKCQNCNKVSYSDVCRHCIKNTMNGKKTIPPITINPKPPISQPKSIKLDELDNIPVLYGWFLISFLFSKDLGSFMTFLGSGYIALLLLHTFELIIMRYHYKKGEIK